MSLFLKQDIKLDADINYYNSNFYIQINCSFEHYSIRMYHFMFKTPSKILNYND